MRYIIRKTALLLILGVALASLSDPCHLRAQTFKSFPAGDDSATSLGQFRLIVDSLWVDIMDAALKNSVFTTTEALPGVWIYDGGVFTSPVLFDPATTVGRSDGMVSGAFQDNAGVIAGRAPGRTYLSDLQMTVSPTWPDASNRVYEIHTFIKSLHLTDSLTTGLGFSVKAGMQAPTRPVSAGEVEAYNTSSDFPARSFFNVFVQVDIPAAGPLPAVQLVNVDPLLVESSIIYTLPPTVVYIHGNTNAVSIYFNTDLHIPDPFGGPDLVVPRGTLFGQLTLAGHGMGYGEFDIPSFETEIETELRTPMPLNANPFKSVSIEDFSPNYNALPPARLSRSSVTNGTFFFTVTNAWPGVSNYVQVTTNLLQSNWVTIGTHVPAGNVFTFTDSPAGAYRQRFYRVLQMP